MSMHLCVCVCMRVVSDEWNEKISGTVCVCVGKESVRIIGEQMECKFMCGCRCVCMCGCRCL